VEAVSFVDTILTVLEPFRLTAVQRFDFGRGLSFLQANPASFKQAYISSVPPSGDVFSTFAGFKSTAASIATAVRNCDPDLGSFEAFFQLSQSSEVLAFCCFAPFMAGVLGAFSYTTMHLRMSKPGNFSSFLVQVRANLNMPVYENRLVLAPTPPLSNAVVPVGGSAARLRVEPPLGYRTFYHAIRKEHFIYPGLVGLFGYGAIRDTSFFKGLFVTINPHLPINSFLSGFVTGTQALFHKTTYAIVSVLSAARSGAMAAVWDSIAPGVRTFIEDFFKSLGKTITGSKT